MPIVSEIATPRCPRSAAAGSRRDPVFEAAARARGALGTDGTSGTDGDMDMVAGGVPGVGGAAGAGVRRRNNFALSNTSRRFSSI